MKKIIKIVLIPVVALIISVSYVFTHHNHKKIAHAQDKPCYYNKVAEDCAEGPGEPCGGDSSNECHSVVITPPM